MNRFDRERWDTMGKEALSRVEELMNSSRINELLHKREEDEKKKNCIRTGHHWSSGSSGRYCIRCIPFLYSGLSGRF